MWHEIVLLQREFTCARVCMWISSCEVVQGPKMSSSLRRFPIKKCTKSIFSSSCILEGRSVSGCVRRKGSCQGYWPCHLKNGRSGWGEEDGRPGVDIGIIRKCRSDIDYAFWNGVAALQILYEWFEKKSIWLSTLTHTDISLSQLKQTVYQPLGAIG